MTYGGIYRDVYVDIKESQYIQDVFVKPEISGKFVSEISLSDEYKGTSIKQIVEKDGVTVCEMCKTVTDNFLVLEGRVENPELWDVDNPILYQVKTELMYKEKVVDIHQTKIGFRSAQFEKDGFYLNDKKSDVF